MGKGNSSNFKTEWDRGFSVPGAFKLDHLHPFKPLLFWKFSNFFPFILGGQFLLPQRSNNGTIERNKNAWKLPQAPIFFLHFVVFIVVDLFGWIIPFTLSRLTALICIPFAPPRHRRPRRLPSLPCCVWRCLWSMPTLWYKEKVSGAEIRPQCVNQSLLRVMRVLKRTNRLSHLITLNWQSTAVKLLKKESFSM